MADAKKFYRSLTLHEKRFIGDKTMSTTMSVKIGLPSYHAPVHTMPIGIKWPVDLGGSLH